MPEHSEDIIQKVRYLTRKNPTLQNVFLSMLENEKTPDFDTIKSTFELYQTYKNLLNSRDFDLKQYDGQSFETLFDAISHIAQENKKRRYALSFISKKYAHLLDEKGYELFDAIRSMEMPHEKVNEMVVKKIARYQTPEQFNNALTQFIETVQNDGIKSIKDKITDNKLKTKIIKEDHTTNKCLVEIGDYNASEKLGSPSWCISTSKSYFKNYVVNRDDLDNKQYFLWNFEKEPSDALSLIGFTMSPDNTITVAHDKNDKKLDNDSVREALIEMGVELYPYTKDEVFHQVKHNNKLSLQTQLVRVATCLEDNNDKDFFKDFLGQKSIDYKSWSFFMKKNFYNYSHSKISLKAPEVFFKALEEICWESQKGELAFNNADKALTSTVWDKESPPYSNSIMEFPFDINYFWPKSSIDQLWDQLTLFAYYDKTKDSKQWVYTNTFNIDFLNYFNNIQIQSNEWPIEAKKLFVREMLKTSQEQLSFSHVERMLQWDNRVFDDLLNYKMLIKCFAHNLQTLNEVTQGAEVDNGFIKAAFQDKQIVNQIIQSPENIEHLTSPQFKAVQEHKGIETSNYDTFKTLEEWGLLSKKSFFQSIKKVISNETIDLESAHHLLERFKANTNSGYGWKFEEMEGIVKNPNLLPHIHEFMDFGEGMKNAINFLRVSQKGSNKQALEVAYACLPEKSDAIEITEKLAIDKPNDMAGFLEDEVLEVFFERYPPNEQINPENTEEKSEYEQLLVKAIDQQRSKTLGPKILSYCSDENQNALLLKSSKADDPIFQFLMNKHEQEKEKQQPNKTQKNRLR